MGGREKREGEGEEKMKGMVGTKEGRLILCNFLDHYLSLTL